MSNLSDAPSSLPHRQVAPPYEGRDLSLYVRPAVMMPARDRPVHFTIVLELRGKRPGPGIPPSLAFAAGRCCCRRGYLSPAVFFPTAAGRSAKEVLRDPDMLRPLLWNGVTCMAVSPQAMSGPVLGGCFRPMSSAAGSLPLRAGPCSKGLVLLQAGHHTGRRALDMSSNRSPPHPFLVQWAARRSGT